MVMQATGLDVTSALTICELPERRTKALNMNSDM